MPRKTSLFVLPRPPQRDDCSMPRWIILLLIILLTSGAVWCWPASDPRPSLVHQSHKAAASEPPIAAFMGQYCLTCHGGSKPAGQLSLDKWKEPKALGENVLLLDKMLHQLEEGAMPPEEAEQPAAEERSSIQRWLREQRDRQLSKVPVMPPRITLRRLNRLEYNLTVRDLLGVAFQPADDFPNDDIGYGFDNIGDVLTVSPLLLEKYLRAAEAITNQALTAPKPVPPSKRRVIARDLQLQPRSRRFLAGEKFRLLETGKATLTFTFPSDGEYIFRFSGHGQRAGEDPPRMRWLLDGRELHTFEVTEAEPRSQKLEHRQWVQAGERTWTIEFINPHREPAPAPDTTENQDQETKKEQKPPRQEKLVRRLAIELIEIDGPHKAPAPPPPQSYQNVFRVRPGGALSPHDAARQIILPLAARAYRRPVTEKEVDQLLSLFDGSQQAGESFDAGVRLMVQRLLISPHFLFHVERIQPKTRDQQGIAELDSYAMASRLSYALWCSMPDEELFQLAEQDRLRDPEVLSKQMRRMIQDEKAQAMVQAFTGQWLQLRKLEEATPDPKRFAGFTAELRQAMRLETELFFMEILRSNRPIHDLLSADFTYMNARLAEHYGIPGVQGPEMRRVSLKGTPRGGVLTQASLLTVTSNPTRTSPVKRGKWIMENVLGTPPPPPPPGAGDLPEGEQAEAKGSVRQRLEIHRSQPQCATCHTRMDTFGFALENFNPIGQWRDHDGSHPVDATGSFPNGQTFRNLPEFRTVLLSKQEAFRVTLMEKWLTFALGHGLHPEDRPWLLALAQQVKQKEDRFMDMIEVLVLSDIFRKTRGE